MLKQNIVPGTNGWGMEDPSAEGLLHTSINGEIIRKKIPTEPGNYAAFYELLFQALNNGSPVPVTAADGRNVIDVIEKGFKSSNEKKIINI
jgi:scyllo-inositol 2-dehydrogenase (NADP+)